MYGERRGAAYGLASLVKGLGILSLKQQNIMSTLQDAIQDKKNYRHREGWKMISLQVQLYKILPAQWLVQVSCSPSVFHSCNACFNLGYYLTSNSPEIFLVMKLEEQFKNGGAFVYQ